MNDINSSFVAKSEAEVEQNRKSKCPKLSFPMPSFMTYNTGYFHLGKQSFTNEVAKIVLVFLTMMLAGYVIVYSKKIGSVFGINSYS